MSFEILRAATPPIMGCIAGIGEIDDLEPCNRDGYFVVLVVGELRVVIPLCPAHTELAQLDAVNS